MFTHVFNYRLKCLLRDKETVFWTLLFPLLLATFFYFAFGHLTARLERFNPVKTVVVDNQAYRKNVRFRQVLESLSTEGENQILELIVADEQEAERLLEDGVVVGIITAVEAGESGVLGEPGGSIGLTVKQRGINQSILKAILDEYAQTTKIVTDIAAKNPGALRQLIGDLENRKSYTEQVSFSNAVPDTMLGYFYALIAMACMYSSFWGLRNTIDVQPDLSAQGARRSVAPTHKLRVVLADAAAAFVISFAEVLILLMYLAFVLGISFGNQFGYVLLTCLAGCISGVSLGNFIGTVVRGSENVKTGILVGTSMTMSFLAGLMFVDMKDIVARKAPVLSYINPAALISDAFYSLYVFDTHRRFFTNIGMLCLISAVMCMASFMRLRRERYASI
ncbi:MAG: ABC transporter permease [Bacillota bacterium]|jgi:ABC-2 type transport system permease protein